MKSIVAVFCICTFLVTSVPRVLGQAASSPLQDWGVVKEVVFGQPVEVETKRAARYSGFMVAAFDTELQIQDKSRKKTTLQRDQVRRVWTVAPSNHTKPAITGAVIGMLTGILISAALTGLGTCTEAHPAFGPGDACPNGAVAAAFAGSTAAGAFVGYKLGEGKHSLIYSVF
jgi:hypothetical protein